jgi:hypothetical protein
MPRQPDGAHQTGGSIVAISKVLSRVLALAAVLLVAGAARAESWRSYRNDRFGVTADYPAGWTMGEAPANNDGRTFTSPDGTAQASIYGALAHGAYDEEMKRAAEPVEGENVTYSTGGENWIVLSGFRNGERIFYRKTLLSCYGQVWNTLDIEYPSEDKARFDRLVSHMAASLRPSEGYGMKCD